MEPAIGQRWKYIEYGCVVELRSKREDDGWNIKYVSVPETDHIHLLEGESYFWKSRFGSILEYLPGQDLPTT